MKVLSVDGMTVTLEIQAQPCESCGKPMIYNSLGLNERDLDQTGVMIRSSSSVCAQCAREGKLFVLCSVCYESKPYPKEFKYEGFERYEGDTRYICKKCVQDRPHDVIDEMFDLYNVRAVEG